MQLTVDQLHEITAGQLRRGPLSVHGVSAEVGRIVTSIRDVQAGDVFWALSNDHVDEADVAEQALTRGAAGVITSRPIAPRGDRWSIEVSDPRQALHRLVTNGRAQFARTAVAVAGNVGKSTTGAMIHAVLKQRMRGTVGPEDAAVANAILGLQPSDDYAIVECDERAANDMAATAALLKPHIAVVTGIGGAAHDEVDNRGETYSKLLCALPQDGCAILNGDDAQLRRLAGQCSTKMIWVGRTGDCDIVATTVSVGGQLSFQAGGQQFHIPVFGRHHLTSALLAIGVCRSFGLELDEIADSLLDFQPLPWHCQVTRWAGATLISDCNSSNPASVGSALELLRDLESPGRRIAVVGDMLDICSDGPEFHQHMGQKVMSTCGADMLLATGSYRHHVVRGAQMAGMPSHQAIACQDAEDLISTIRKTVQPGDAVLIKGSRAMGMQRITQALEWQPRRRAA
jgi:UDP-N-acetylmuramoyl-tripeptide--D-alanyl-D-alanine ligase